MVSENTKNKIKLNLLSAELLKIENTFYILNRSLGMTWYLSTIQTIFNAGDNGVGCGNDDDENKYSTMYGYDISNLKEGYWYQGNNEKQKTPQNGDLYCESVIPTGKKYNKLECNPKVCMPNALYLKEYLIEKMKEYHTIKTNFEINNIDVTIADNDKNKISTYFSVEDDKIKSYTTQKLKLENVHTKIETDTKNEITIYTEFNKMITAGNFIVAYLFVFSNNFLNEFGYKPNTENKDTYLNYIMNHLSDKIKTLPDEYKIFGLSKIKPKIYIDYKDFRIRAPTIDEKQNGFQPGTELILHYDADIKIIEGGEELPESITPIFDWPTKSRKIVSCYGPRTHPIFGDSRFHKGIDIAPDTQGDNEYVMAIEDGEVVKVEKDCDDNKKCGGGYGNYILLKHENGLYSFYAHLKKGDVYAEKGDKKNKGDIIARMGTSGVSTGVHLHFEIRSDEKKQDNPCKYIDCTQSTINKCTIFSGLNYGYFYHDEDENIFERRPFSLVFGVEDYLPVLNCRFDDAIYKFYTWYKTNDMVCCYEKLWTCNLDIENLPQERKIPIGSGPDECNTILRNVNLKIICNSNGSFEVSVFSIE